MTAAELAGLRPGDRVYTVTTWPEVVLSPWELERYGWARKANSTAIYPPAMPENYHSTEAAAFAAALAESRARHDRLAAEARRHGVEVSLAACLHCEGSGFVGPTRFDGSDGGPCGECEYGQAIQIGADWQAERQQTASELPEDGNG